MKRQFLHTALLLLAIWCGTATEAEAADITTDTQMKVSDGTTAFATGNLYEGLAATATVELIATQPTATYNTATETGKTLDFSTLSTATGVLKDATAITLTGVWTSSDIAKLTSALVPATGNNTTLLTADLDAMTFSGESLSMENLFRDFKALTSVTMPTATYAGSVDLTRTFPGCPELEGTIDLSMFSGISSLNRTFSGCPKLTGVKMPERNAYTGSVDLTNAFYNCSSLERADLSAFTNMSGLVSTFQSCSKLTAVTMPKENKNAGSIKFGATFCDCIELSGTIDLSAFTNASSVGYTFGNCLKLTAVKFGTVTSTAPTTTFYNANPNCLVYVPAGTASAPSGWDNCIADGKALGSIVLEDGKPFRCPEAFEMVAGNRITYTRNFGTESSGTGGAAAGWETVSLPFTPTEITGTSAAGSAVTLVPFNAEGSYEGKGTEGIAPFWLRSLSAEGYQAATAIEPDKPYIIALPNNTAYDAKFNVTGTVTFRAVSTSAAPLTTGVTPDALPSATGNAYTLHGNYSTVPSAQSVYVINTEGTAYVANGGDALPFRPYVTANSAMNAPAKFVIGKDEGGATAIEEAVLTGHYGSAASDGLRVYGFTEPGALVVEADALSTVDVVGIDGRTVRTVSLHEGVNVVNGLAPGIYVAGGQKAVVR